MRLEHASYSALNLYGQCPLRFKIERVEKRKAPDTPPLRIGSAVHAGIAAYIRHLQEDNLQTDITWSDEALEAAAAAMKAEKRTLSADEWEEVGQIFASFISSHMFDPSCIAEVEKREKIPLDGLAFWTVIDFLEVEDGQAKLRDWKSSWRVPSQAEVSKDFQLRVYAWAVNKLYGFDKVRCALDFVRHGAVREVMIGPEDIAATEKRILETIEAIEAETEWAPTPGSHCSYCPWASGCPAVEGDDPEELAGLILVLEAQLREAQAKLKAYCVEHGPVVVGGERFSYFDSHGLKATDVIAVSRFIEMRGLDPAAYFSINNKKLQPLLRDKVFAAEIEPYTEETISTSFRHKKAGGD
ncbi:MAG: PD-(D/E)XK nuclease family protein [bacterium]